MKTSLSWIKRYVPDLDVTAKQYMDAMTLSGTKVEGVEELDRDLDKIVVGLVRTCEAHPDSDHLQCAECLCRSEGTGGPGRRPCGRRP